MNVRDALISAIHEENSSGWRDLADNEFRISSVGKSSKCLFLEKENKSPPGPPMFTVDGFGVVSVVGSESAAGNIIHRWIQEILKKHPDFIGAERLMRFDYGTARFSGKIDIELYKDADGDGPREPALYDIKTCSTHVFKYVTGQSTAPPRSYSELKQLENYIQVNHYACFCGYSHFYIIWVNRDDLKFKIEHFSTNEDRALAVCELCERVISGTGLTALDGVALCDTGKPDKKTGEKRHYCHYRGNLCRGFDAEAGAVKQ